MVRPRPWLIAVRFEMPNFATKTAGQVAHTNSPLVSICIPTYNGARWIRECLTSALSQTYRPIEVLVVDDASSDGTVEEVLSLKDEHVRVIVSSVHQGMLNNWNKSVELARGEFIKFLFQDDILYPDCIEKLIRPFLANENLGLAFAPRDILVEGETVGEHTKAWLQHSSVLHSRFKSITAMNNGRDLFEQYLRQGFRGNWIGEPSSVLIKRLCFSRLGPFNRNLYQVCDVEMWLRVLFFYDVGFIPEKLSAFRFHPDSTSRSNIKSKRNCLDQLWLLEGLLSESEIKAAYPEIEGMRWLELMRFVKTFLRAPIAVALYLKKDPVGRRGFLILPAWAKSAAWYAFSRLFRHSIAIR